MTPDRNQIGDTTAEDRGRRPAPGAAGTPRRRNERGASLVEYALLVALIAVILVTSVTALGETRSASLNDSAERVGNAIP